MDGRALSIEFAEGEKGESPLEDELVTGAVTDKGLTKYHARLLAILFFVWLLTSMNNQLYSLVAPLILLEWNLTYTHLGFISSTASIGSMVGLMTFGALADYFGRKKLLVFSVLGIGLAGLCSFSQNWVQLGVALLISHFAASGIFPLVFSLASEELPPRKRGLGVSIIASAYGLGGGFLSGLVTNLLAPISWRLVFLAEAAPSIAVSLAVSKLLPESRVWAALRNNEEGSKTKTFSERIKSFRPFKALKGRYRRGFAIAILVRALASLLWMGIAQWVVTYMVTERRMSTTDGATWFALFGIFGFFGNWINGLCADKLGRRLTIPLFFIGTGFSVLALTLFAKTETEVFVMTIPIGIALLGLYPTTFTITSELLPSEAKAGASALISVLLAPMTFALPILIGVGATVFSFTFCFSAIAAFTIALSLALFLLIPETRGKVF